MTLDNLCGTGNLVFGSVNTLEILTQLESLRRERDSLQKEIESLRQQVKAKDDIIVALSEASPPEEAADPPTPAPVWYTVKAARRRPGQAPNSWDPTFPIHTNRFSLLQEGKQRDPPLPPSGGQSDSEASRQLGPAAKPKENARNRPTLLQDGVLECTTSTTGATSTSCDEQAPAVLQTPTSTGHEEQTPTKSRTPAPCNADTPDELTMPRDFQAPVQVPPQFYTFSNYTAAPEENPNRIVVTNPYPEARQGIIVPGEKLYSQAHLRKILVVSDSMTGGIRRNDMMAGMKERGINSVDLSFRRYGGGQSHEIYRHAQVSIAEERPHGLVLVAGTNDLPRRGERRQLTDEEIANNLLATGQAAREQGVTNIFISSIIIRRGLHYAKRISNINRLIDAGCRKYGFKFLDNRNINLDHTDSHHLAKEGTSSLQQNINNRLH